MGMMSSGMGDGGGAGMSGSGGSGGGLTWYIDALSMGSMGDSGNMSGSMGDSGNMSGSMGDMSGNMSGSMGDMSGNMSGNMSPYDGTVIPPFNPNGPGPLNPDNGGNDGYGDDDDDDIYKIPSGYISPAELDAIQNAAHYQTQLEITRLQQAGETERTKYIEDNKKPLLQTEISGKLDLQKIVNAGYTQISRVERGSKMMGNITSMFNF